MASFSIDGGRDASHEAWLRGFASSPEHSPCVITRGYFPYSSIFLSMETLTSSFPAKIKWTYTV